jgi:hypothetical protein
MVHSRARICSVWVAFLVLAGTGACASQGAGPVEAHAIPEKDVAAPHSNVATIMTPPGRFGILSIADKDGGSWVVVNEQHAATLLAVDVAKDPFKLHVPGGTKRGTVVSGSFSVCVSEDGRVAKVSATRGMGTGSEAVDKSWVKTMKRWRYRPYTFREVPTRFCTTARPRVTAP